MKILVINGPNLNMLGKRDPTKYGRLTLVQINNQLREIAKANKCRLFFFQSNSEGILIDYLQTAKARNCDGILINPGALVRYGYCLRQALIDIGLPLVEIHMSNIDKTGINKSTNVLKDIRLNQITGHKEASYYQGLEWLIKHLSKQLWT